MVDLREIDNLEVVPEDPSVEVEAMEVVDSVEMATDLSEVVEVAVTQEEEEVVSLVELAEAADLVANKVAAVEAEPSAEEVPAEEVPLEAADAVEEAATEVAEAAEVVALMLTLLIANSTNTGRRADSKNKVIKFPIFNIYL